jgi:hypothetical protein
MEERYFRTFSRYLKERFGEKVYRICIDAGFGCPNRDGTIAKGGCAYCSPRGSWSVDGSEIPLELQVRREIERVRRRYGANKYIAYFQAYTNTYAPPERLKAIYNAVVNADEGIVGMAIGTRPDCVDREKLELIASYKERNLEVWMEYGLQSASDETLRLIGRGHTVADFRDAVMMTEDYELGVIAHVIIGLPGEGRSHVLKTASFLADLGVSGVKLHNLNIIEGTRMADWYREGKVKPLEREEYAELVVDFLERSDPSLLVVRLVTDSNPRFLIAPTWSLRKQEAIEAIIKAFERRKSFQGRLFSGRSSIRE